MQMFERRAKVKAGGRVLGLAVALGMAGGAGAGQLQPPPMPVAAAVPASTALSLKQAVDLAVERSNSFARVLAASQRSDAMREAAGLARLPQVQLTGGAGNRQGAEGSATGSAKQYGVSVSQVVYDFGKSAAAVAEADALAISATAGVAEARNALVEEVALLYAEILRYRELVAAARESERAFIQIRELARIRAEGGLSNRSDPVQADVSISGARASTAQLETALAAAETRLGSLVGQRIGVLDAFPGRFFEDALFDGEAAALEGSAALRRLGAELLAADERIAQAKADRYFKLRLVGQYERADVGATPNDTRQVMLMLDSTPLWTSGAGARVKMAVAEREGARAEREERKRKMLESADIARAEVMGAVDRRREALRQWDSARKAKSIYVEEYKLGRRSFLDLLNAEQAILTASNAEIGARYDGVAAMVRHAALVEQLGVWIEGAVKG